MTLFYTTAERKDHKTASKGLFSGMTKPPDADRRLGFGYVAPMSSADRYPYAGSHRHYRGRCSPRAGETGFQVVVEQTDLWVVAERDLSQDILHLAHHLRGELKAYMALHPEFGTSLRPVSVSANASSVVRAMADAAARCDVGPMAAVAGAIAQFTAAGFTEKSPNLIVENGGDIALHSTRDRVVGLLPDPSSETVLGLTIAAKDFPVYICSSSATIGHSLSLGRGELVAVRSQNGCLADAAATALCNMLQTKKDLQRVLAQAQEWSEPDSDHGLACGIDGVLAQCGGQIAVWGKMELTGIAG